MNNRPHRKLLVVDGVRGFTGGLGIGREWTGHAQDPSHWRDTHYEITGPVVAQMRAVFIDNWIKATREVLHGDIYFPKLEPTGSMDAQMFSSSPEGGGPSLTPARKHCLRYARGFIQLWQRERQQVAVSPGHRAVQTTRA